MPLLSGVVPSYEMLLTTWEQLADMERHLKPWITNGLKLATMYYSRLDKSEAYIISMCEYTTILCTTLYINLFEQLSIQCAAQSGS
jgi:hypothetical protein